MQAGRPSQGEQNFRCLEGLRGYMAWCVVASHAIGLTQTGDELPRFMMLFVYGTKAVNEFIILSGFVIAHLVLSKAEPYKPYIVRRGFRIIPIYFACLLIAVLVPPVGVVVHTAAGIPEVAAAGPSPVAAHPWPYIWLHLTLLHGVVPDSILPSSATAFLGPAWSLSLEWQFYLVAPFIIWALRKSIASQLVTTAILLGAYFVFTSEHFGQQWKYPSMLFLSIHFFLIGMLSRLWLDRLGKASIWIGPALVIALACLLPNQRWELSIWAVFYTAVFNERFASALPGFLKVALEWLTANRLITTLGRVSYSTYLIHLPLFSIVVLLGHRVFGVQGRVPTFVLVALAAATVIPVSFLLYGLIERRFIRIGKRFHAPKQPVAVGEAA
jgi:peptidoglycan/LPS O-acetylase OafA/YrhL